MTRVALLIGVSNYGPGLQSLPGTASDVEALRRVLEAPDLGGFNQVQTLLDPDPLVMQEAIEVMLTSCLPEDLALVFFSGHSLKDEQGSLYLGTCITRKNAQGQLVKSTAVPARVLGEFFQSCPAERQVIILDCCFSGAFADILVPEMRSGPPERVLMASSTAVQYSLSTMQGPYQQLGIDLSTFTHYLTEGIATGAASPNGQDRLSIQAVYDYAQRRVQIAAPGMQPQLYASEVGKQMLLTRTPTRGPELVYLREIESWISGSAITPIGRSALAVQQQNLNLSVETADRLEALVLRPYREYGQRLQRYEQLLLEAIQREHLLSQENQSRLKRLRQVLGLTDAGVSLMTLQMEEYGRCLQRYEQALREITRENYPPNAYAQRELQQLQRVLGLSDRDIATLTARGEEYYGRLQRYEQALVETVQQQYPLSEDSCKNLQRLQTILKLSSEDITPIVLRVEAYRKRLLQYEQELTESVPWQHLFTVDSVNELAQTRPLLSALQAGELGRSQRAPTIAPPPGSPPPTPPVQATSPPEPEASGREPESATDDLEEPDGAAAASEPAEPLPDPPPPSQPPDPPAPLPLNVASTNPALPLPAWGNPLGGSQLLQTPGGTAPPSATYLAYPAPSPAPPGVPSPTTPPQNPFLSSVAIGVGVGVLVGAVGCLILLNLPMLEPTPTPTPTPTPRSQPTVGIRAHSHPPGKRWLAWSAARASEPGH